jgi:hypothetical protein
VTGHHQAPSTKLTCFSLVAVAVVVGVVVVVVVAVK